MSLQNLQQHLQLQNLMSWFNYNKFNELLAFSSTNHQVWSTLEIVRIYLGDVGPINNMRCDEEEQNRIRILLKLKYFVFSCRISSIPKREWYISIIPLSNCPKGHILVKLTSDEYEGIKFLFFVLFNINSIM